ncbi:hypothetical protein EBR96_10555, partial [bacterium]|nr:hypothetical protein [bacterium]
MKYYWINVDESAYRYAFMKQQFDKLGVQNARVSAMTPSDMKDIKVLKHPNSKENDIEIAVTLSHIKAIKQGYDDGDDYFCVVEDDMFIPNVDFEKIFKYMKDTGDDDIEAIQLFTSSNVLILDLFNKYIKDGKMSRFLVKRDGDFPCAGYYMISRRGAKKLLDLFIKGNNEYDLTYSGWAAADNIIYKPINSYILTYPITIPNINCGSLIHPEHLVHHSAANNMVIAIHNKFNILHYFL